MKKEITVAFASFACLAAMATSPVHNKVFEYVPAPGQFVNLLPEWSKGDNASIMAEKALEATTVDESIISLGAFGGYVTFGFPSTIVNVEGKRDIYIEGNAFKAGDTSNSGASAEPGVVMVSYDINGNGLPDDEWFEIAGSEYRYSTHNYEITYFKPASDNDNIKWTDNQGKSGEIVKLQYHKQPYWPQWLAGETELKFKGTRLPDNAVNQGTTENPYFVLYAYDYGYADNHPNLDDNGNYNEDAKIDIDWAVDQNGNAVKMPGVDFVRIYTGTNQFNGWIGESSTEVGRVLNAHIKTVGNVESVDESVKIDQNVLNAFLSKYGQGGVGELANDNVRIYVNAEGIISFTINRDANVAVYDSMGKCRYTSFHKAGKNEVNISNFESGIYIVNVDGKSTKILKK